VQCSWLLFVFFACALKMALNEYTLMSMRFAL
jgi:hypothetical protein